MEARKAGKRNTERARHLAIAANSEYLRRHPDAELPPLKSAEPPRPSEEESAELPRSRDRAPSRRPGSRNSPSAIAPPWRDRGPRSLRVPNEDHEWEDRRSVARAVGLHRDAILQPPKPEIRPAAEVAERARELSAPTEAQSRQGGWRIC